MNSWAHLELPNDLFAKNIKGKKATKNSLQFIIE